MSEKPGVDRYPYTTARRADDLIELITKLGLKNCVLVAHDWGGAVGMCAATQIPDVFSKIILMNTASYLNDRVPKRIRLCHIPVLKRIMLQGLNVFPIAATTMATAKGLSDDVKAGLLAPYDSWSNRVAVCEFVQDIPVSPKHRSYQTFVDMMKRLPVFKDKPVALIWGVKDWCFPPEIFLEEYLKYYPKYTQVSFFLITFAFGFKAMPESIQKGSWTGQRAYLPKSGNCEDTTSLFNIEIFVLLFKKY